MTGKGGLPGWAAVGTLWHADFKELIPDFIADISESATSTKPGNRTPSARSGASALVTAGAARAERPRPHDDPSRSAITTWATAIQQHFLDDRRADSADAARSNQGMQTPCFVGMDCRVGLGIIADDLVNIGQLDLSTSGSSPWKMTSIGRSTYALRRAEFQQ
jgi:hypothetical protein